MSVPINILAMRWLRYLIGLPMLLALGATSLNARGPEPPLRIPLEPLGFQALPTNFLVAGDSLLTLHFVDDQHVLLTFAVRRLLKRLPDDPADDDDRAVDAILLELPSGKVLGRTEWRLHDHSQYLWSLGHGKFILRIRDTLTTIAPLANLASGQPFLERPFLSPNRHIRAILLSPDEDLVILETVAAAPAPAPAQSAAPSAAEPVPVLINFYRIFVPDESKDVVRAVVAGAARARRPGNFPVTVAGYLSVIDEGHHSWAFDFNFHNGKVSELPAFDSSCRPSTAFVSHSEFIALGCHGGNSQQQIAAFNLRGDEMWEQTIYGSFISPSLVFAPTSGRFAFSRLMINAAVEPTDNLTPEEVSGQSVVVYQTSDGKQILRAACSPVERNSQNFALSSDGMDLAVVNDNAIEIYKLPPLTSKELAAVKLAEASSPEAPEVPIQLVKSQPSSSAGSNAIPQTSVSAQGQPVASSQASVASASVPVDTAQPDPADASSDPLANLVVADPASSSGSASSATTATTSSVSPADNAAEQPQQPRKPPTLYNLPTDPQKDPAKDTAKDAPK